MKYARIIVAASYIGLWPASGNAGAADINVEVRGIVEAKGEIRVVIFNQAEGWLKKGVAASRVGARVGTVVVTFPDLADGEYAISVTHDVNGNGKLDTNLIGMPIEPYGFSNGATGKFGPPSYDRAKVRVDGTHRTFGVQLQ